MLTRTVLSSDPVATLADAIARSRVACIPQPTVADLVSRAVADTDFLGDLTPNTDTMSLAADCADQAAEQWEDAFGELPGTVAPELVLAARDVLRGLAEALQLFGETDAANAIADAVEAGDTDRDGAPVAYDSYRSARP